MRAAFRNLLLFLGCFGLFGFFAHGYLENSDVMVTMQGARAWWLRGNPGLYTAEQAAALDASVPTWPTEQVVAGMIAGTPPTFGRVGVGGKHYVWFPIGHQALLTPCVAMGDAIDTAYPSLAAASVEARNPVFGAQFGAQFVASFLSPAAAALSVLLLMWLARSVSRRGRSGEEPLSAREALMLAGCVTLSTQFLPGAVETMSNAFGSAFLFASALGVARSITLRSPVQGDAEASDEDASVQEPAALVARKDVVSHESESTYGGRFAALCAGVAGGIAVLLRYPQAISVACLGAWLAVDCLRRGGGGRARLAWFAVGGLPALCALLAANVWRFDSMGETGYSASAGLGGFPLHLGLLSMFAAPGKGVLWFSPLLFLVLPMAWTRRARSLATLVFGAVFCVTLLLYAGVVYWAGGQCWGIRYMTAPIVMLSTVVLAQSKPWRRWPRRFFAVVGLGVALSLGGLITAYPGQQHLAFAAGRAVYGDVPGLDQNVNYDLSLSPLHSHWSYAWASVTGRLDPPEATEASMVDAVFGVAVPDRSAGAAPVLPPPIGPPPVPDRGMRHLWMLWLAALAPDFPWLLTMFGWVALTALLLVFGIRGRSGRIGGWT